jgi:hypothetical protein
MSISTFVTVGSDLGGGFNPLTNDSCASYALKLKQEQDSKAARASKVKALTEPEDFKIEIPVRNAEKPRFLGVSAIRRPAEV